jgi:hypothetical protein
MQRPSEAVVRQVPVLDDAALSWAWRLVWALCIGVYLTVFIGGIQAGGNELLALARAAAFTLATGILGRMIVGLLSRASLPEQQGPLAVKEGPLGSLGDLVSSTNVAMQEDEAAQAVLIGER